MANWVTERGENRYAPFKLMSNLTNLRHLDCRDTGITELDLTGLTRLTWLRCHGSAHDAFTLINPAGHTLVVNKTGAGSVTIEADSLGSASATLTATPDNGNKFVRWTENGGEVSMDAAYTFTLDGNRSLAAVFEAGNAGFPGDVNGDGKTDAVDAALILRYAVDLIEFDAMQFETGDTNSDGAVDSLDAAMVLRHAVELIDLYQ